MESLKEKETGTKEVEEVREKKNKTRQSNIELLRIIAMIFIISFHMTLYEKTMYTGSIKKTIFSTILSSLGLIGVNIFILITGYFQIEQKFKAKKILKIWLQTVFYSALIIVLLRYFNIIKVDRRIIFYAFLPVTYNEYWFISSYILLYLFSPFINKFAKCLSKNEYKNFLIIFTFLFSITYTVVIGSSYRAKATGLGNLAWFIYLYLLAGYIKLYEIKFLNNKKLLIASITVIFIVYETILVLLKFAKLDILSTMFIEVNSAFVLSLSILIFSLFKELNIKSSRVINYVASTTLTAYLIHENYLLHDSFWRIMSQTIKISNLDIINTIFELIIAVILIFAVSAIMEPIRRIITNKILKLKYVNDKLQKIDKTFIA